MFVARTSTSVTARLPVISQSPTSTPWMVVWRKVAEGLRMNRVIFNIDKARRDAKVLISGVVGSSHETTPFFDKKEGGLVNDGVGACAEFLFTSYTYQERHGLSL